MSPTKKEELRAYEDFTIGKKVNDLFENGTQTHQSWKSSMFEAHVNSLIGAPIAIAAHALVLFYFGAYAVENPWLFATMTWPMFFYLSVSRIYIFRRIFERYDIALEPMAIYRKIKSKLSVKKSEQNGET